MHSIRMRTTRALTVFGGWVGVDSEKIAKKKIFWRGVLSPGVYLVLGGVSAGGVSTQVLPPVDRQTSVNLLPCPKLHLRAVTSSFRW